MKNIGILSIATQDNGGTFQYTLKMIESISLIHRFNLTIYTDISNECYDNLGLRVEKIDIGKKKWLFFILNFYLGLNKKDIFDKEDIIIAPTYSPVLLSTKRPFIFTLHDLQEYYYPDFFPYRVRVWRKLINSLLIQNAKKIICELNTNSIRIP